MNQGTIYELDKLAAKYNLKLYMPPFNNGYNPFFYIGEIKYDSIRFRDFFIELDKLNVGFRYVAIHGKKDYLEITD